MPNNVTVNGAWIDAERFFLIIPENLVSEVKKVVSGGMKTARAQMINNVSGGVLKTVSGTLLSKVKDSTRATRTGVYGRAGSRWYIGRFWEEGFNHKTRKGKVTVMAPRPWAEPVVEALAVNLANAIEATIDRTVGKGGF